MSDSGLSMAHYCGSVKEATPWAQKATEKAQFLKGPSHRSSLGSAKPLDHRGVLGIPNLHNAAGQTSISGAVQRT